MVPPAQLLGLLDRVSEWLPEAVVSIDEPTSGGYWFVDIRHNGRHVVVDWRAAGGFGVSLIDSETVCYDNTADGYEAAEPAAKQVVALLR